MEILPTESRIGICDLSIDFLPPGISHKIKVKYYLKPSNDMPLFDITD